MTNDATVPSDAPNLQADINDCVSYSAWQNSVPVIRSLTLHNPTSTTFENLKLTVESDSGVIETKSWAIDRLIPDSRVSIDDRHLELKTSYLAGLKEAEKTKLIFELWSGSESISRFQKEIRVLARYEWGGIQNHPELVAAFVLPNDSTVEQILRQASAILQSGGHSRDLDGYQSKDPGKAYLIAGAIWNAVASLNLIYSNPPKSFETSGQKIRTPAELIAQQRSTCLDTALLFAAALESAGLHSILVFKQGHAFAGVWLIEKTLSQVFETDILEIRKAVAGRELITFECTLSTQDPPSAFELAIEAATEATAEIHEPDFIGAVDVQRARMMQIRPIGSPVEPQSSQEENESAMEPTSLPVPRLPDSFQPPNLTVEISPSTPDGRIDRWQRKLLDLTLRNRLLNFRSTLQTLPLRCPDPAQLEDILAKGKKLKFISLPDQNPIGDRDSEIHRRKSEHDLNLEFAEKAFQNLELCCTLALDSMEKRLVTLYRAVRNDMAEGGTNTLFLAVGFLRWKRTPNEKRSYRAPLILVPVQLTRRSSRSPFYLRAHEDETRFNATLIQMIKQDFGKNLTHLENDLPTDANGIDVPAVFQWVRQQVRDIAGMEVVDQCALGRFSFSKYLLWKDLVDRTEHLKNNRVVKHLLEGGEQVFQSGGQSPIPTPSTMDSNFEPADLIHPLDADSSQLAAIMASADGKDFVLIGPPGTGKSQTITNMIAQCLAAGKSVLFVAEKTAALEVVHRRLVQHGLEKCCIELHSNKAERKKFLAQMQTNWLHQQDDATDQWIEVNR
ncbi:MAG: DUF4011 domain-containing protein, partial [Planctomycetota bacterium]